MLTIRPIGAQALRLSIPTITGGNDRPYGRRVGDAAQEPIDAEFTVIDDGPARAQPRERRRTSRTGTSLSHALRLRSSARAASHGNMLLQAYLPYQELVGTLVDTWA